MCTLSGRKREICLPGVEKAELLNDFFALVFTRKCYSHAAQVAEAKGRHWEKEEPPTVGEDQV